MLSHLIVIFSLTSQKLYGESIELSLSAVLTPNVTGISQMNVQCVVTNVEISDFNTFVLGCNFTGTLGFSPTC